MQDLKNNYSHAAAGVIKQLQAEESARRLKRDARTAAPPPIS
jgi:hypothetical protein